jgi:hypothetical protein
MMAPEKTGGQREHPGEEDVPTLLSLPPLFLFMRLSLGVQRSGLRPATPQGSYGKCW